MTMLFSKFRTTVDDNMKWITLIVFATDVVVLIVVLSVLWAMPDPPTPSEDCSYMCMKCTDDANRMCCGCRADVFTKYMDATFKAKYDAVSGEYNDMFESRRYAKVHNGSLSDVKPVAHLIGEDRDKPSAGNKDKEVLPITKWYRGNDCLLLNGVSLHRGRFRVPVNGYYHVYSLIDFNYQYVYEKEQNIVDVSAHSPFMTHAIYRSNIKNSNTEEEVMCTHHPYVMSKNLVFSRYDTYLGGNVYLEAGDEIYVKVANISYASSPPKNVFGLHFI